MSTTTNACTPYTPKNEVDASLSNALRALKKDDLGALTLGVDGVMRSFNADRDIVDAVGLTAEQIQTWFERMPAGMREIFKEGDYKDAEGNYVDGTGVGRDDMFNYAKEKLPPAMSMEEQERRRGLLGFRRE